MTLRILVSFAILLSILYMPFSVSIVLALGAIFYFNFFWEAVLIFLVSDSLFGARGALFHGAIFISFTASLIALIIAEILKKKLQFKV